MQINSFQNRSLKTYILGLTESVLVPIQEFIDTKWKKCWPETEKNSKNAPLYEVTTELNG